MSSRMTIRMNFQRSLQQADRLEELAEQIRKVGNTKVRNAMTAEAAAWKGDNEALLHTKSGKLQEKVMATAKSLKNVAGTIRTIAKNTYDAEMRAWEISHRRTYR